MTKTSILIAVGLLFAACQKIETRKDKYPSGKLKSRYEVTVSKSQGELKNGVYEEFWENGEMKVVVNYLDNREHGLYRSFYENGKLQSELYYIEGLMDGEYREWYENGHKKRFADYRNGQLNGELTIWESDGKKIAEAKFKDGICKSGDCSQVSSAANVRLN